MGTPDDSAAVQEIVSSEEDGVTLVINLRRHRK